MIFFTCTIIKAGSSLVFIPYFPGFIKIIYDTLLLRGGAYATFRKLINFITNNIMIIQIVNVILSDINMAFRKIIYDIKYLIKESIKLAF
ncbi:hypothetical protein SS11_02605 [Klebsiella aerogenes]|nr:hypothetical protein SS11_02605 [Klebsiella aerogenes]